MINMKLLAVVTPPYIYHGCSSWKPLLEEQFIGEEKLTIGEFTAVNINYCACRNVGKHRDIKSKYKYIALDILLKFGSLGKMRITSSGPKDNMGRSGKGLIASLGIKSKARPKK